MRSVGAASLILIGALAAACGDDGATTPVEKSTAQTRAARRAFDGAPPVIPHDPMGASCTECHSATGRPVPGVGFAPPSPHGEGPWAGAMVRCEQCHVFAQTSEAFRANSFVGLAQDLRRGERLYETAPPIIPHQTLLRENCAACHTGPAARAEILCPHPERERCTQCHVETVTRSTFARPSLR